MADQPVQDSLLTLLIGQRRAFQSSAPLNHEGRVQALERLLSATLKHQDALAEAVDADFGNRSAVETRLLEIFPLADEIRHIKRRLKRWMRPRRAAANWQFRPSRAKILYQPLGVVGVIGAWNYPILLTLSPLANALAAGNHVMIKPSEAAPRTAEAIRVMIGEIFAENHVTVVTGGADVSQAFAALPFDHLIFTGSGRVGKMVMQAAAANLTPVTLELGGKSPALVHESYSMPAAAERICSAKLWNAGQTCVAPDYVLVPSHKIEEFIAEAARVMARRAPRLLSGDYTRMIDKRAWRRMRDLLDEAQAKGAQICQINPAQESLTEENRAFPPTLVTGVDDSMRLMQEEIFGPILPIVAYSSLGEALEAINCRPRPLALYYFDADQQRIDQVLSGTMSGGVTVNDCIFHFVQHSLPFGGVGASGMGAYHGFTGFETFSKKRGVLRQSGLVARALGLLRPPYGFWARRIVALLIGGR